MDIRTRLFLSSFLDRLRRDSAYGEALGLRDLSAFRREAPLPADLADQIAGTASAPARPTAASDNADRESDPSQR